jgi:hypothetical protein
MGQSLCDVVKQVFQAPKLDIYGVSRGESKLNTLIFEEKSV